MATRKLPDHMDQIIEAAVRRRAGKPPCAPNSGRQRDERYARRPRDGTDGYHLWSPTWGLSTVHCAHWRSHKAGGWREEELGPPVHATQVPPEQRCGNWVAPRYFPRPWAGPLPEQWGDPKIPRWYVWWRLHDIQDGTCATCDSAAYVIDHDHVTGLVRGLLCVSCNHLEGECGRRVQDGAHGGEPCFQKYWDCPPAGPLRWLYGKTSLAHA
jgi:hypothetical protein